MPDLHGWISQRIDETERLARRAAALCGCHLPAPSWSFRDGDGPTDGRILIVGEPHPTLKRKIGRRWNGSYEGLFMAEHIVRHDPAATLRRCEADRKILARHDLDPNAYWSEAAMCVGCGATSDCDWPVTDNLNECPELLDLGHAHGLTPETLATLDQPVPPPAPRRPEPGPGIRIGRLCVADLMQMSEVPPGLRGPNWKA